MRAVGKAIAAAVRRRRLQTVVVGLVIVLSSATAVLGLGLLVAANAPFDSAFARQRGAHAAVTFDGPLADAATLTATASRPGVAAAAGPFDVVQASLSESGARSDGGLSSDGGRGRPPSTVVGRAEAGTGVDRLTVTEGTWLTGPGQIVVSTNLHFGPTGSIVGARLTVDVPGAPTLLVVGVAASVTGTADAWIWPSQSDVLHAPGVAGGRQMLYRFTTAATEADVRAGVTGATADLPADGVRAVSSYLTAKLQAQGSIAIMVPFVVAFAVLGLVMSVLIVANVVGGAVVAGYRTIGVLKSLGYTPGQVAAVYVGQAVAIGVPAGVVGVVLGNLIALPLLADTEEAFGIAADATVPLWVDLVVLLGVPVVVGLAALAPAVRAGRLSATQAISVGRAPRTGRGFGVRRFLAATRLPRPVSFGLGTPFTRPGRSAMTVVAVLLGAATMVLALGLAASLGVVQREFARTDAVQVSVDLMRGQPGGGPAPRPGSGPQGTGPQGTEPLPPVDTAAVRDTIRALPGTARLIGVTHTEVAMTGYSEDVHVNGYDGDASWVGYPLIAGRWYTATDEAVATSRMLRLTGTTLGDTVTLSTALGQRRVHIVGEAFSRDGDPALIMNQAGIAGLTKQQEPNRFEIALTDGTDRAAYVTALTAAVANDAVIATSTADDAANETIVLMQSLIATLALLLSSVAALGVFNTVVLNTRDRIHEIGVLKSVGMTPGQVATMVVSSMLAVGTAGGLLAVPLGYLLHRQLMPVIADAAGTGIPGSVLAVFGPVELVGSALFGVVLAVLGALVPATWAGRTRVATALRAE